jgi:hypothetical protein
MAGRVAAGVRVSLAVTAWLGAGTARAQVPLGPEVRVNTFTTGMQLLPSLATRPDGGFVVVWSGPDGSQYGVLGRRFDAGGGALDPTEFVVNAYTTGTQGLTAVASAADGRLVVTWGSPDGSDYGLFGRWFDALGVPQPDFRVNTYTPDRQIDQRVAMDTDGDFVVVWRSDQPGGSDDEVIAQRYDGSGVAQGGEFRVNAYTTGSQGSPAVGFVPDGGFIVVWDGLGPDDSMFGVYGQRYDAGGAVIGAPFHVNTYTTGGQDGPVIAVDPTGGFVVAWQSYPDFFLGGQRGLFARRFDASATPLGAEFQVNSYTTNVPRNWMETAIASDADGDWVVAWRAPGDMSGTGEGIWARRYDARGVPDAAEFEVNSHTTGLQRYPTLAVAPGGAFVVAWSGAGPDGGTSEVYARRFIPDLLFRDGFQAAISLVP